MLLTVDHHTAEILGIHAAARATRCEALEAVRQAVHRCFGSIREKIAAGIELRHDHGSQYRKSGFVVPGDFSGSQLARCVAACQWSCEVFYRDL